MLRHDICVFSVEDMPEFLNSKYFFVNKFLLEFDPIAYQCMEERLEKRKADMHHKNIDLSFYCDWIKRHSKIAVC